MEPGNVNREDFIKLLVAELKQQELPEKDEFDQPLRKSLNFDYKNVFQALCFDFPDVEVSELKLLTNSILTGLDNPSNSLLPDGVVLNAKFFSGIRAVNMKGEEKESSKELQHAVAELSAVTMIKFLEKCFSCKDKTLLSKALHQMIGEDEPRQVSAAEQQVDQFTLNPPANANPKIVEDDNRSDASQWASEEDSDDFEYEGSFQVTSQISEQNAEHKDCRQQHIDLGLAQLRHCIMNVCDYISYDLVAALDSDSWQKLHLNALLCRIVKSLFDESCLLLSVDAASESATVEKSVASVPQVRALWPKFLFLIRDRLVEHPYNTEVVFPAFLEIANAIDGTAAGNSELKTKNPVVLGALAAVVSSPQFRDSPKASKRVVWNTLVLAVPLLGTVLDTLAMDQREALGLTRTRRARLDGTPDIAVVNAQTRSLMELFTFISYGDPCEPWGHTKATDILIKNGILRTATSMWQEAVISHRDTRCSFIDLDSISLTGKFLASCISRSAEASNYVASVPQVLTILNDESGTVARTLGVGTLVTVALSLATMNQRLGDLESHALRRIETCFNEYFDVANRVFQTAENTQDGNNSTSRNPSEGDTTDLIKEEVEGQHRNKVTMDLLQSMSDRTFLKCLSQNPNVMQSVRGLCRSFELRLQSIPSASKEVAPESSHPKLERADRHLRVRQLTKRLLGRMSTYSAVDDGKLD